MLRSETAASPERRVAALAGLKAYQDARRSAPPEDMPVRHRVGTTSLRDHGGGGRTVLVVPSLINPPTVLDLAGDRSLLRWLAQQGLHPWLVDWGAPRPEDRDVDISGHVADRLLPLIAALPEPPLLVGYCLGGTMACAAAALAPVAGLALIATPWRFSGYGAGRDVMRELWTAAEPGCAALGLVPMEVLQTGFWRLDPARTIAKYEAFGAMTPESPEAAAFVALEDWANAGAPLTYAAGAELFDGFLRDDRPGSGRWQVAGRTIDPHALPCPATEFVSLTDRIVPAAAAADLPDRRDLGAGHVGMVVGSHARTQLWEPLAEWLRTA